MNSFSGGRVLIVEDDLLLREVLTDLFAGAGAKVYEAESASKAMKLLAEVQIDIVFSDARMPGGDGLTLAKSIQQIQGKKPLVFLCSGYNDLSIERIKELDIIKVFEKPFDPKAMLQEILTYAVPFPES